MLWKKIGAFSCNFKHFVAINISEKNYICKKYKKFGLMLYAKLHVTEQI
jgi:hypothetical protein